MDDVNIGDMIFDGHSFNKVTDRIITYADIVYRIRPAKLPEITVSGEHELFVFRNGKICKVPAYDLNEKDYLLIPKVKIDENKITKIDLVDYLPHYKYTTRFTYKVNKDLFDKLKREIDKPSNYLGKKYGLHPAYVRQIRKKIKSSKSFEEYQNKIDIKLKYDDDKVIYGFGKYPVNRYITDLKGFARILGYYTADGSLDVSKTRPNSYTVRFCFGKHKVKQIEDAKNLIEKIFGIKAVIMETPTTMNVEVRNTIFGIIIEKFCGKGAKEKTVPVDFLLKTNKEVIKNYLDAYISCDGCKSGHCLKTNTVSKKLAYGIYLLYIAIGYAVPSMQFKNTNGGYIDGRKIKDGFAYYLDIYKDIDRKIYKEIEKYYLLPIRYIRIEKAPYKLYDFTVEPNHKFVVNNLISSNCYLSDAERTTNPKELTPDDLKWIEENIRPKKVVLMGGEPTLYKHFLLALEIFSDSMVTVATNGTLIDKFIPVLRKFDVEGIQLSVEGGRKETDELRGEGTWDMVLKKAKLLKKKGLNPYLRSSFWSGNYKNLTEVMDAGEEIGIPVVFFPRVDKPPLPPGLTRDLFDKALGRKNCIIAMPNFFQYIGKKGRCGAGEERICVFYDKRITPCNLDLDYTLGRIGDDVESIKTNMKVFVENFKTIPAECIGCLLYTSPSPRDRQKSRMPSSA